MFPPGGDGFITSPAEVDPRPPIKLRDAEVSQEHRVAFEGLCEEFTDVFSQNSADLGKTPLMRMEIPTGDNPPISQRPYGLALRHVQWVQDEIEILERVGVITKSVSPWASPIVIVPKKTSPGEPPRRRMCVLRYDTIGKIELIPSIVLSSDNTKYKNNIQLFLQLFDELSVYRDYH